MGSLGVSNLIIVESENDQYFISYLIDKWSISNTDVNHFDYKLLGGLGGFAKKIRDIKYDKYNKIGIVIDADSFGVESRVEFTNQRFKEYYQELSQDNSSIDVNEKIIDTINQLKPSINLDVNVALYVTNVEGKGELETLLKSIKSKDSDYADCLYAWRDCASGKDKKITDKEFDKFWVNNYLRFDTCSKEEKKQAGRKCSGEFAIKKDIWNLEHPNLDDLKKFLQLFVN
jgi:hypothetical protein